MEDGASGVSRERERERVIGGGEEQPSSRSAAIYA
jgi:hypothetical protein